MKKRSTSALSIVIGLLTSASIVSAHPKTYQTTKVIEVSGSRSEFCLVVQIDDLAYVSVADEHVPPNLIVGDSVKVRIKNDNLWIAPPTTHNGWVYGGSAETKTKIVVRKRMTEGVALPSCSLSVTLH